MNFFQIFKFGTEIIEILQTYCYITKFLHELLLSNILLEFLKSFSIFLGNISSIYKSFEFIHQDTGPLT